MITEIRGNLLDTDCKILAHGVNCQGVMASGVAKALYEKWPEIKEEYLKIFKRKKGKELLGKVEYIPVDKGEHIVINCYTQEFFGPGDDLYLSYEALRKCMKYVHFYCVSREVNELAIPRIGCGLAGGDWEIVKQILEDVFPPDFNVKVYSL